MQLESRHLDNRVTRVVVDDRERSAGVVRRLRERADVKVVERRLTVGDYLVDGRLLAERKTLADFGLSVRASVHRGLAIQE